MADEVKKPAAPAAKVEPAAKPEPEVKAVEDKEPDEVVTRKYLEDGRGLYKLKFGKHSYFDDNGVIVDAVAGAIVPLTEKAFKAFSDKFE